MAPSDKERKLLAVCERLRNNDPYLTCLDLGNYGEIEWKDAAEIATALKSNTRLTSLCLVLHVAILCADGSLPFADFVRASPSLQTFSIAGGGLTENNHDSTTLPMSLTHNISLTKLELLGITFRRPDVMERILATTPTLRELEFTESIWGSISQVAQALRKGLEQNQTLEEINWHSNSETSALPDVLDGLSSHPKLKTLALHARLTHESSRALNSFLKSNRTVEAIDSFFTGADGDSWNRAHYTGSWQDMLERNRSLKTLILADCRMFHTGPESFASFLQGVSRNTALKTLCVSRNRIGSGRAAALADALRCNGL